MSAATADLAAPRLAAVGAGDTVHVDVAGRSVAFQVAPPPDVDRAAQAAASSVTGSQTLVAPMPGSVLTVHVRPGARVETGDPVVTLEAMKMEHAVTATASGVVREVDVAVADQVIRGQRLAHIEPPATDADPDAVRSA